MSTFAIHSHVACTYFDERVSKFAVHAAHPKSVRGTRRAKVRPHKTRIPSGSATTLTYDLNGNMTSDGTNSYAWDCENRLIKITYPGTGNYSTFAYDGFSRNVQILEYASSSLTSTKNFVWSGERRQEARNSAGTISAQYFSRGELITGAVYFFTRDKLGSVRELTSTSASIQSQLTYDPFGSSTLLQGSLAPDFQFASYYRHTSSGLNLTLTRAYNAFSGRFISRDSIGERGGINLFDYVSNNPLSSTDPRGTDVTIALPSGPTITLPIGNIGSGSMIGILFSLSAQNINNLVRALRVMEQNGNLNRCADKALKALKKCDQAYCAKSKTDPDNETYQQMAFFEKQDCYRRAMEAYVNCIDNADQTQLDELIEELEQIFIEKYGHK